MTAASTFSDYEQDLEGIFQLLERLGVQSLSILLEGKFNKGFFPREEERLVELLAQRRRTGSCMRHLIVTVDRNAFRAHAHSLRAQFK
jgi:hypothetical protein